MMSRRFVLLGLAGLVLCLGLAGPAQASHHYVVETSGNLPPDIDKMVAAAGGSLKRAMPEIGLAVAAADDPSFAGKLASNSKVVSVTEDTIVQWVPGPGALAKQTLVGPASGAPEPNPQGAFFFGCQWSLNQIQAPGAWAEDQFGSPEAKVAVLDTGVDPSHIDLNGRVDTAHSASVLTPGSSPCGAPDESSFVDFDFHGTFVSSLITTNNLGIAGVAPKAQVVAVKVLNCQGFGSFGDVIAGIHYASHLDDVQVLNMSLGALIPNNAADKPLIRAIQRAVDFATDHGKLVVAAAGNNGIHLTKNGSVIELPAQANQAAAIYATTITQTLASYTNFGEVTWVGAPGGDLPNPAAPLPNCPRVPPSIQSLIIGACAPALCGTTNRYVLGAGTSFASPLVAAVAELINASRGDEVNPHRVKHILAHTADRIGSDDLFSHGRVNARRAVNPGEDDGGEDN
ncbi:MAG TPA: S8 family serine peptidase [Thermoanaerobaculia bacterium]|nr:S8 family serine peptidase [Thermoanaerobaculia bacterium]